MKANIVIIVFVLLINSPKLLGQNISLTSDSIPILLCKKWEVNYAMLGGLKIGKLPGAPEINYEFKKDNTFILTSSDPAENGKGSWIYDVKKKIIKLTINGQENTSIVSLKRMSLL